MAAPRFLPSTSFHQELKSRVKQYFQESNQEMVGTKSLYVKAIIMVASFLMVYFHLFFFDLPMWLVVIESVVLGGLAAGIGFNVMHDGAHGSFSRRNWVNELAGLSINFLGANVFMWKTKHNVVHHSFTNVDEFDDDLNARPFLRLSPEQKRYGIHRYQHYYFIFTYAILYLYWVFFSDYKKYFSGKVGETPIKRMAIADHISFWSFKLVHLVLFIFIPIYMVGFVTWLVFFLVMGVTTGVVLSMVFQLAHSVEDTSFPIVSEKNQLEDEWAVHQLRTTANFATKNKLITWLVGGLNYQVEHHLFPNISHVHYPAISDIIRETCEEYGIPYLVHPKMRMAIASHVSHLKHLGRD